MGLAIIVLLGFAYYSIFAFIRCWDKSDPPPWNSNHSYQDYGKEEDRSFGPTNNWRKWE